MKLQINPWTRGVSAALLLLSVCLGIGELHADEECNLMLEPNENCEGEISGYQSCFANCGNLTACPQVTYYEGSLAKIQVEGGTEKNDGFTDPVYCRTVQSCRLYYTEDRVCHDNDYCGDIHEGGICPGCTEDGTPTYVGTPSFKVKPCAS